MVLLLIVAAFLWPIPSEKQTLRRPVPFLEPETEIRQLIIPTLPPTTRLDQKRISRIGDYLIQPANDELKLEERAVLFGRVSSAPEFFKEEGQLVCRMIFSPVNKDRIEVEVSFGQTDQNLGIFWAPQGDLAVNPQWSLAPAYQIAEKIKTGDELIIHLSLTSEVRSLLDVLEEKPSSRPLKRIGPVIQLIAGNYD